MSRKLPSSQTETPFPATGPRRFASFQEIANFIWAIADLLRGDYKQADYGKVIQPFTVLRRMDCVLARTKEKVLKRHQSLKGGRVKNPDPILNRLTGAPFHNSSKLDFERLTGDPNHIASNLTAYIRGFSANAREVIERFKFADQIAKLDEANLLYLVVKRFSEIDLHPDRVSNHMMGLAFEDLIRRVDGKRRGGRDESTTKSNETAEQPRGPAALDTSPTPACGGDSADCIPVRNVPLHRRRPRRPRRIDTPAPGPRDPSSRASHPRRQVEGSG